MLENTSLPNKLRRKLQGELAPDEVIRWIEQPIPRFLTRTVVGTCLSLLVPLLFFAFVGFSFYKQLATVRQPLLEFPGVGGILVFLLGTLVPLFLIFYIPIASWLEARQTVYVITDKRAFVLTHGWSTTITSFISSELRVILRREHADGSGDLIVYLHKSTDADGDTWTQEIGFKQIRNPRAVEQVLRRLNPNF